MRCSSSSFVLAEGLDNRDLLFQPVQMDGFFEYPRQDMAASGFAGAFNLFIVADMIKMKLT